jgi:hypothetical protein
VRWSPRLVSFAGIRRDGAEQRGRRGAPRGTRFAPTGWMRRVTGVIAVIFAMLSSEACSPRPSTWRPVEQPRSHAPQRRAERPARSAEVPPRQSAVPASRSTAQQSENPPVPVATVGSDDDVPGVQPRSGRADADLDSVRQPDSRTAAAEANSRNTTAEWWLESSRVRAPGIRWAIGFFLMGLAFLIGAVALRRLRSRS